MAHRFGVLLHLLHLPLPQTIIRLDYRLIRLASITNNKSDMNLLPMLLVEEDDDDHNKCACICHVSIFMYMFHIFLSFLSNV